MSLTDSRNSVVPPDAIPIVDRIARLGFAAKGIVAIVVGAVALRFALGYGADLAGPEEALRQILSQPLGFVSLAIVSLGLWAHALWKMVQAVLDPEEKGRSFTAIIERTAFAVAAIGYLVLGLTSAQLLIGKKVGNAGSPDELVARILTPTAGRWAVGVIGLIVVIAGALQIRLAITAGFRHVLLRDRMSRTSEVITVTLGRAGYGALGVISAVIGYFLIRVAQWYAPSAAGGWSEALGFLAGLEYGRWLLGAVAIGLLSYGLFFVLLVKYRETL